MLNDLFLVLLCCVIWAGWSLIVGYSLNKVPNNKFAKELTFVNTDTFERLNVLQIKKWKDKVPEAGDMFKGGVSKSSVKTYDVQSLKNFVYETRRAEYVHYSIMMITPVFFLFLPAYLIVAMILYAVVANIPCLLIQRYNRSRILHVLKNKSNFGS